MRLALVLTGLWGLAALLAIPVALIARAEILNSQRQYVWPEKRITLDLDNPDEIRRHVDRWTGGIGRDELFGSVEPEDVLLIVHRNDAVCAIESTGVHVDIDLARRGKAVRVFIATPGMTLNETVLFTRHFLAMLNSRPRGLDEWGAGEKGPAGWPQGHHEFVRTEDTEYSLEIRCHDADKNLWWIAISISDRHRFLDSPPQE